jgi:hypothetical protein
MQFKLRWHRFSYKLAKRVAEKEKKWGVNETSFAILFKFFPLLVPSLDKTMQWRKVHVNGKWRTIDGLIVHLQAATRIARINADILEPKHLLQQPVSVRLYDFLMTENRLPVTLSEVVRTLQPVTEDFLNALKEAEAKDEFRGRYYRRRYAYLLEATFYFVQTLIDLATWE